jgi:hypothetical protein
MTTYNIFINSNEHPRTINSFRNARCWFTCISVQGREALVAKVEELRANGEHISEIRTNMGTYIYL